MTLLLVLTLTELTTPTPPPAQAEQAYARAYQLAYNLDHDEAIALLKQTAAARPNDPAAQRHVAVVTWLNILFRRGSVTVDSYLGGITRSDFKLPDPPAALAADFHAYSRKAVTLAEARVAANPDDVDALFDLGSALGLQASYVATIDGKVRSAFGAARKAYDLHEDVLERDPNRHAAGLIVGTYRYVVSALSFPVRWAAYIVGFGGGKERGIQQIEAAARSGESQTDARFALVLIYNREKRFDDAVRVLSELQRQFPRNRLLWLEKGSTLARAGRGGEAEAALTEGLRMTEADARPAMPGERALWLYKRGSARVLKRTTGDARNDLETALGQRPLGWVQGRIHLELGKVADLEGNREAAKSQYYTAAGICEAQQDPNCRDAAKQLLERAYR
jgi:tetratricopeptide (TPR) repeat protein